MCGSQSVSVRAAVVTTLPLSTRAQCPLTHSGTVFLPFRAATPRSCHAQRLAEVAEEADLAIALVQRPRTSAPFSVIVEVVLGELQRGGGPVECAILVAAVLLARRQLLQVRATTRAHTTHHDCTASPALLCQRLAPLVVDLQTGNGLLTA